MRPALLLRAATLAAALALPTAALAHDKLGANLNFIADYMRNHEFNDLNQVASGARTREQVRVEFKNSPEFQARVNAVIAQGCLQ